MGQLVRLFAQIALLRRGPQDVPASPLLLALTVAAYFLVTFVVASLAPPFEGPWLGHLCVDVVFMFVWYGVLLTLARRPERFLQTATAVYGFQTVLAPLFVTADWLTNRVGKDSVWSLPVNVVSIALLIWMIAACSHIVKASLEWAMPTSVALVILQTLLGYSVMLQLFPLPNSTL